MTGGEQQEQQVLQGSNHHHQQHGLGTDYWVPKPMPPPTLLPSEMRQQVRQPENQQRYYQYQQSNGNGSGNGSSLERAHTFFSHGHMSKRPQSFSHEPAFNSPLEYADTAAAPRMSRTGRASVAGPPAGGGGILDDAEGESPELYRTAVIKTLMSVAAAGVFGAVTWMVLGQRSGMEFFAGYLVEQSLSVDNLFVFIMLFDYFAVPIQFQSRVLTWGIIGAVVMRGIMIGLGVAIVKQFRWIIIIFAGILLVSSWKLLQEGDEEHDLANNTVVKLAKRLVGAVDEYDGDRFFTRQLGGGRRVATPLLLCLVCIELSDFVFAVDSIPAVLGVSTDPFIVYSSNIFAIMGLRSVYTIIARAIDNLPYLKPAVALVLGFVGLKMILEFFHFEISTGLSLTVVVLLIGGGVGLSVAKTMLKAVKRKNSDSSLFQTATDAGGLA
eukprot:TRINITY_DN620_c0_g1_i1.p1 TRINITY_DN620_c0_g1~~TRINITY_DN620_c0_g1_i1.p1  ORF type:complete len:460 (-),score=140.96 TRINITY_DN620_c0_g1_i1:869-2185(-)